MTQNKDTVRPEYKRIRVLAPHCPKCKEELRGDNRFRSWYCTCGTWKRVEDEGFNTTGITEYRIT